MIKLCKVILVAMVAAFFTLIAFNNITDYGTNFAFVKHVLSMDSTWKSTGTISRSIKSPLLDEATYILIISWQSLTALICWVGAICLFVYRDHWDKYVKSKAIAFVGLTMGFSLYAIGFLIVGGEVFLMWQSKFWNGQQTASIFINFIGIVMLILLTRDE